MLGLVNHELSMQFEFVVCVDNGEACGLHKKKINCELIELEELCHVEVWWWCDICDFFFAAPRKKVKCRIFVGPTWCVCCWGCTPPSGWSANFFFFFPHISTAKPKNTKRQKSNFAVATSTVPPTMGPHIFIEIRKKKLNKEEGTQLISKWLGKQAAQPFCLNLQKHPTTCQCFRKFDKSEYSCWIPFVAAGLYSHCFLESKKRKEIERRNVQLILTLDTGTFFPVPAEGSPTSENEIIDHPLICKNKLLYLLNIGRTSFETLKMAAKKNLPIVHGLTEKPSNYQLNKDVINSLHLFFNEMSLLAAPRATRMVRMETGKMNETEDNDKDLVELPTNWTCRRLFGKWIETRGWKIKTNNQKGNMEFIDLPEWEGEKKTKCGINGFCSFWKKNYPKLILPKPRQDICNECFILANSFRYATNNGTDYCQSKEDLLSKAKKHIDRATSQRLYFNAISNEAKEKNHDVLVMDYCQNLALPYFGSEQPGQTYYLSPLNIFVFGIYNVSNDKLDACIYHEGHGKKGGNNVASMIYQYLERHNMIPCNGAKAKEKREKLSIVMDNCAGQNKVSEKINCNINKIKYLLILLFCRTEWYCDLAC